MSKRKFKVTIPYWDSGVRKKFESEFKVEAENKEEALAKAIELFNQYEKNNYASWVRVMYKTDIKIEEEK